MHIMLDLETWGTRPGCDIRSIGAVVMAPHAPQAVCTLHTFYMACDNPQVAGYDPMLPPPINVDTGDQYTFDGVGAWRKYPLHRDARTVQWWSEQSAEAQAAFADPCDTRNALAAFTAWLLMVTHDARQVDDAGLSHELHKWDGLHLYAHGPQFDISILAAAYEAVGLPAPWHYRAPRDTRTCFDMAGITDHSAWLTQHATDGGIEHHALDDAITQARAVCAAMERNRHPEWIKLTQEAPPLHTSVLVRSWGVGPTYDVAVWTGERFVFADVSLDPKQVTHWAMVRDLR